MLGMWTERNMKWATIFYAHILIPKKKKNEIAPFILS